MCNIAAAKWGYSILHTFKMLRWTLSPAKLRDLAANSVLRLHVAEFQGGSLLTIHMQEWSELLAGLPKML